MTSPDGYTKLPPGKIANSVTWLELTELSPRKSVGADGFALRRLLANDAALYRQLFRTVGTPWLWAGMINKTDTEIATYLARTDVLSFAAVDASGEPVGILDLCSVPALESEPGLEVAYFGLIPNHTGKGLGAWLMGEAIGIASEYGASRLWLHTCNFDHPGALTFYQRQGFQIYAQGFEIMDDPRHLGLLPPDAASHVPMISDVG